MIIFALEYRNLMYYMYCKLSKCTKFSYLIKSLINIFLPFTKTRPLKRVQLSLEDNVYSAYKKYFF